MDTDTSIYSLQLTDDFGIPLNGVPILLNHEAYVTTNQNGEVFIATDHVTHLDLTLPTESDFLLDRTVILQKHKVIQAKRKTKVSTNFKQE